MVPNATNYMDPSSNIGGYATNPPMGDFPQQSTAVARRQPNQVLVPTAHNNSQWSGYGSNAAQLPGAPNGTAEEDEESVEQLEQRAQRVKKEVEGGTKKKTLPPFVLKLLRYEYSSSD